MLILITTLMTKLEPSTTTRTHGINKLKRWYWTNNILLCSTWMNFHNTNPNRAGWCCLRFTKRPDHWQYLRNMSTLLTLIDLKMCFHQDFAFFLVLRCVCVTPHFFVLSLDQHQNVVIFHHPHHYFINKYILGSRLDGRFIASGNM